MLSRVFLGLLALSALAQEVTVPGSHFHHVHLNSTDPEAAVRFYTARFACESRPYAGQPAVWAQPAWLLFQKVKSPPPYEILSTIWHIGWGAENMPAEYQRQLALGTKFETPITDISDLAHYPGFFFAYVDGPDHVLIELNTAAHHHFGHLHLLSEDPVAAGEWYMKHFGATSRSKPPYSQEPRFYQGFQVGPGMSLNMDGVNIIIFPAGYAAKQWPELWKGRKHFESTRGRVIDHIGFSVPDKAAAMERLKAAGVKVDADGFVIGPDEMRIELVEDPQGSVGPQPAH